jgi:hypothetical protein
MLISTARNFIFVHNQKSAGTSIAARLAASAPDCRRLLPMHAPAADGIAKLGRDTWDSYYSFGFVRNPWARLVSWYSMICERPPQINRNSLWDYVRSNSRNFEEFVMNCSDVISEQTIGGYVYRKGFAINQLDYFIDGRGDVAVSFIGKFEQLERDFEVVSGNIGLENTELEWKNRTQDKDFTTFYSPRTRDLVAHRFRRDIEYFEYTFEP